MKKTLLITTDFPPTIGGVANYYKNIVDHLPSEKISVMTNDKNKLLTSLPIWPKWLPSFWNIWSTIRKEKIEMLLVGQILPLGTVAWLLHKITKTPYIVMTHAMDVTFPQKYPRKKWLMKKILARADKVTTVSRFTEQQLKTLMTGSDRAKIEVIYPCPNLRIRDYNEQLCAGISAKYVKPDTKIILSVGRIVERKGFDAMIEALAKMNKEYPNFNYLLVGEGEYKKKLQKMLTMPAYEAISNKIKFVGKVPDNELACYFKLCDVFAMPSRRLSTEDVEGFGIVYLEANLFGKPVIGGDSGGIRDAVKDGQTGFLVDPTDTNMIAEATLKLLTDPERAQKIGFAGQERVLKEFTWKHQTAKLEKLLS
ncbi:glycosyltransferase family 4 protein [Patescibacteria group bacterium]|nr:glycosyltransferase family 4 protein [Patescibacteria group bacterium]MBU1672840.1 glycosyltransferase family 4 protein [Patescibacteria group bacterium]MBU1963262.1 glycosyltransferase family 4 protein [Patescibacteria group bacterium]